MENGNGQTPAPKISGFSTPVGSSTARKQKSPAQRSNTINQQNAPAQPKPTMKQQFRQERPVTQEEVDAFRKKRSRNRKITAIVVILVLIAAAIIGWIIYDKLKITNYNKNATIYNDNLPIVVRDGDTQYLITQNGNKIGDNYSHIDEYTSESTLAINYGETVRYFILDANGKAIFQSENIISKSTDTNNYIMTEGADSYILKADGQKLTESKLVNSYNQDLKYSLVQSDSKIAIIDENGKEKFTRVIDGFEATGFSFAYNKYEDKYYCAISTKEMTSSVTTVYNCETAKIAKTIEDSGYYADFYDTETPMLSTGGHYYYFYSDDVLFDSEQPSTEIFAGIIQTTDEEGNTLYFDPKDKTLRESYPTHSLIAQNKLDATTEITADCSEFAKSNTQKLTKICNNIYQDNKLIKMDYTKYSYHFFPDELAQYLGYLGKNYIIRESVGSYSFSVYDLDKKSTVEGLTSIPSISPDNKASYIYASAQGDQITYYNILTDKTVTASPSNRAELGINYLAIDDGSKITYYNKNAEEIYKVQKGE